MPRATTDLESRERLELKSLPEGFVELRRMSYGEILQRRDMGMRMVAEAGKADSMVMEMIQTKTTQFEFERCITDHNLEDHTGRKLNFRNMQDFQSLDPRVAQEIEEAISKMNGTDEGEATEATFQSDQG